MVNFHDPITILLDSCVYPAFCLLFKSHWAHLFAVAFVKLSHTLDGLYMCVCAARRLAPSLCVTRLEPTLLHADGNSSQLLTTSGVLSEDVYPIGGRYGCVVGALSGDALYSLAN
jgi:hypothetical protein